MFKYTVCCSLILSYAQERLEVIQIIIIILNQIGIHKNYDIV